MDLHLFLLSKSIFINIPALMLKNMTTKITQLFIFLLLSGSGIAIAQNSDYREKFTQGNFLILEENYVEALKEFQAAYLIDSSSANINYKLGFCYMKSVGEKAKAAHYLEKACQNVTHNYTDLEPREKKAPENAYYFLAMAYHLNYRFDEALDYYAKFKALIGPKNKALVKDIDYRMEICRNGKELYSVPTRVDIINLGDSINTEFPEYAPVITADESMLIFTSRRQGNGAEQGLDGLYPENIYVSYRKPDGTFGQPHSIGANVNTGGNVASISLTPDGQQLFIYKGDNGGDLYVTHLDGDSWTTPESLGDNINSPGWETHACLSADQNTLYFVSNRPGGYGGRDIYKCVKLPNGKWSKATNLGPTINTEYDEDSPFIHPNKVDLYFSSRGHKTMGGFDIFVSTLNPDSNKWSAPMNIGYPINTTDDDIFFVVTPDGKRAYYSSARPGGHGATDIYEIVRPEGKAEKAVALIKGYITSADGGEIPTDIQIIAYDHNSNEVIGRTSPIHRTGSYTMILDLGRSYKLSYMVNGTEVATDTFDIPAGADYRSYDKPLLLNNLTLGHVVKDTTAAVAIVKHVDDKTPKNPIHTPKEHEGDPKNQVTYFGGPEFRLYFTYNAHNIELTNPDFVHFMDSLCAVLKTKGSLTIRIKGSASQVPTSAFNGNRALALKRAADTKDIILEAFKSRGIDTGKVTFEALKAEINGPAYKFDGAKNKATYEKHQYVSVKYALK
jgi:tetratricopeptide (TPR) repeat protein